MSIAYVLLKFTVGVLEKFKSSPCSVIQINFSLLYLDCGWNITRRPLHGNNNSTTKLLNRPHSIQCTVTNTNG